MDAGGFDITALDEVAFSDAAANPTASARLRRNGGRMVWAYEDARTNSVVEAFAIQATTSGTPAAGIGTGIVLRAESADENPSDFGRLDAVALDVTAGSEDTAWDILTRVAGAALTAVWRLQATGAFRATVTHANTAARTYTFQDSSDTIVGRDTTDTLTNKTLTSPTLTTPVIGSFASATHTHADAAGGGNLIATQAEMETATSTAVLVAPGRAHFHPGAAKAWGVITHPTTVTTSYPATGVSNTNPATGQYVVTHGLTMSSANYAVVITGLGAGLRGSLTARTTTTFTVSFRDTSDNEANVTSFDYVIYGDL